MIAAVTGLIVGIVGTWLFQRQRINAAFEQGKSATEAERAALTERLASRDAEVGKLETRAKELEAARAAVDASLRVELQNRAAAEQAAARVPQLEATIADAARLTESKDRANSDLKAENARLATELEGERALGAEKLSLLNSAEQQLQSVFRALSAQALQANNQAFLDLAKEALGKFQQGAQGDLEKRQQAIHELVAPVKVSLDKLDGRIQEIEKQREGAYQALTTQVRSLAQGQGELQRETANLVRALRQPIARGRWGELQLRRVVEIAGMLEHCDFIEQATVEGMDGRLRPDMVVRLPGARNIVIDAKTPLTAYLDAVEAESDELRKQHLVEHARQVRDHMTKLGR
jgi:DNA recombination protein RmuC